MTTTTSAALHKPSIKAEEADRPVAISLHAHRLRNERVKTMRCVGCGEKRDLRFKRYTFWKESFGVSVVRASIFVGATVSWFVLVPIMLNTFRPHSAAGNWVVALASLALVIATGCLATSAAIPHLKTSFARCVPCRNREWGGAFMTFGVSLAAVIAPLVVSVVIFEYFEWRADNAATEIGGLLTMLSGLLVVAWLSPIFRAGRRRKVIVKKVTKTEIQLQVPPTFNTVLSLEHPELLRSQVVVNADAWV